MENRGKLSIALNCFFIQVTKYIMLYSSYLYPNLQTPTYTIWTPHCNGQFALSLGKESPYIFSQFNPLNTDALLIQTPFMPPSVLVSILMAFNCTCAPSQGRNVRLK